MLSPQLRSSLSCSPFPSTCGRGPSCLAPAPLTGTSLYNTPRLTHTGPRLDPPGDRIGAGFAWSLLGIENVRSAREVKDHDLPKPTMVLPKTSSLETSKRKKEEQTSQAPVQKYNTVTTGNSDITSVHASAIWFSEGQFPHNTIIPNHDE